MSPVTLFSSMLREKNLGILISFFIILENNLPTAKVKPMEKKMFGRVLDLFLRGKLRGVSIERGGLDLDPEFSNQRKGLSACLCARDSVFGISVTLVMEFL
jgi:hypothetical protein